MQNLPVGCAITLHVDVSQPKLQWVDSQITGNGVRVRLHGEDHLWTSRATVGAERESVGIDGDGFDSWQATVSQLPSDLAWQRGYELRFGTAPTAFADLYYDAASLLIRNLQNVSSIDSSGDLVINKDFRITETHKVEFRAELFNAFNHPQFDDPVLAPPNNPQAGKITSASDFGFTQTERVIQFGLKYVF